MNSQSNAPAGERIGLIDGAKGVGIFLVVLGHNTVFSLHLADAKQAIYLFHMPLFFFLSGLTFKLGVPLKEMIYRRWRTLLVPYFAVALASLLPGAISGGVGSVAVGMLGILYGTGHTLRFTALWFLPCLFLACVVVHMLLGGSRKETAHTQSRFVLLFAAIAATAIGLLLVGSGRFSAWPFEDVMGRPLGAPWSADLVPIAMGCLIAGMTLQRSDWLSRYAASAWLLPCAIAVLAALIYVGESVDLNYRRISLPLLFPFGVLGGIAATLGVTGLLLRFPPLSRLARYVGTLSLIVLLFHMPIQRRIVDLLSAGSFLPASVAAAFGASLTIAVIAALDAWVIRPLPLSRWIFHPSGR
ncbi:MAG: acyltransferase family protein [Steroidobacteraceae bacterium]